MKLSIRGQEEQVGTRPLVMGILNVTDDSFYDGGKYFVKSAALDRTMAMYDNGADIIDVGGESTRPGAEPVPAAEEIRRVVPVISELAKRIDVPISIDTYKSKVAKEALEAGADIINDISALRFNEGMADLACRTGAPVVLMHMNGLPRDMQNDPVYYDVIDEIRDFLEDRVEYAVSKGIDRDLLIVDPGIGFGKTTEHNLRIISELGSFRGIGCHVLIGPSHKSFIGNVLDLPLEERLEGTAAAVAVSVMNGADIVRVHDVKEMVRVVKLTGAIAAA